MTIESAAKEGKKFPELFFGLVSAVGTDVPGVVETLKTSFVNMGYKTHHIKISESFDELSEYVPEVKLKNGNRFDRVNSYIDFGNKIRERYGNGVLAEVAISQIVERRTALPKEEAPYAYIIDQLKTEEELTILREVYGKNFYQISIYSARDIRVENLARLIAHDNKKADRNKYRPKAEELVNRDESEPEVQSGQRVGKIFQYADLVVNVDLIGGIADIGRQVQRFVDLLFGANFYSPNKNEYGMYLANSAALRSLDLSRQVGAAIFRRTGEVATLGTNEVPKAGGGTYWSEEGQDAREYKTRRDSNDERKAELLHEILEIVIGKDYAVDPEKRKKIDESQFMDALEYGRIVHAEMCALTDAARLGIPVQDGTLYCTTFPCHICAKHIVAAGIAKVVFLEPYPKSLTADMHSDAVKVEGMSRGNYEKFSAANFVPFYGITPRRYREMFTRAKRKAKGQFQDFVDGERFPRNADLLPWYAERENFYLERIQENFSKK